MINKKFFFYSFCFFLFISLVGCSKPDTVTQEDFLDLGREGFIPGVDYSFFPFKDDSLNVNKGMYNFDLVIRFSDKCKIKSLPLEIQYPVLNSDSMVSKKINAPLFDGNDESMGKGNFGLFETKVKIIEKVEVDDSFYFSVMTEDPNTAGVVSIGYAANKI